MVAFGRKLEQKSAGLEVMLHYASTHRVPLHQKHMESIESEEADEAKKAEEAKKEAATDPTYSNYKKLPDYHCTSASLRSLAGMGQVRAAI